jgi:predicted MFS family arabinose efflux permease
VLAGFPPRTVFLVGIFPALLVFWIRRNVPEPAEWRTARARAHAGGPGVAELFRGDILPITLKTIALCALSLTAWWAFMFWHAQHLRNLPELESWARADRERLVSKAFFIVTCASIVGNFAVGGLARLVGYRRAIAFMCLGLGLSMMGSFGVPRGPESLVYVWYPIVGLFGGVFGLFTMYIPPLFPTLLRTTGAGFCYNIGRVAAAAGTVFFGLFAQVGNFRFALLYAAALLLPATVVALRAPDLPLD